MLSQVQTILKISLSVGGIGSNLPWGLRDSDEITEETDRIGRLE